MPSKSGFSYVSAYDLATGLVEANSLTGAAELCDNRPSPFLMTNEFLNSSECLLFPIIFSDLNIDLIEDADREYILDIPNVQVVERNDYISSIVWKRLIGMIDYLNFTLGCDCSDNGRSIGKATYRASTYLPGCDHSHCLLPNSFWSSILGETPKVIGRIYMCI